MSVDVNLDAASGMAGALVATSALIPYFGWIDAITNTTVTTSDPSNPRIDTVVAYVDLSLILSSVTNNNGAFKFMAVHGTAASSPSAPTGAAIQSAIGAGNPYVTLANLAVAAGSGSVVNANITDTRLPMALFVPYLYGGANNTKGHLVPNVADDTLALLNAAQTFGALTVLNGSTINNPLFRTWDGWQDANETWTYLSASSFKVSGVDVTAKYPAGTKIKVTQTTVKYLYVTSSTFSVDTTVNVTGGSDYSLASAAITAPFYSNMASPAGHPSFFNGTNAGGGGGTLKLSMQGHEMKMWGLTNASGTITAASSATLAVTFPVAFATAPVVTGVSSNNTGSGGGVIFQASDPTTTAAAGMAVQNVTAGSITAKIDWQAIGTI